LLAGFAALALLVSPGVADARAGGGHSFGSRGGFTYSAPPATRTAPYSAAPMERSLTQRPSAPAYGQGAYGGYRRHSGFGSALLGGFLGVGLASLLFGGIHGGFGLIWFVIRLLILFWIVRWIWRLISGGRGFAFAGGPQGGATGGPMGGPMGGMNGPVPPQPRASGGYAPPPVPIGPEDFRAFEQTLYGVQDAWSRSDLTAMARLATPEMVSYFSEQLSDYASRGAHNTVTDVRLLQGDLAQSWSEQGRDYATVAMRFSMIDVTRDARGTIVDGSVDEHVTATELWTFLRTRGGAWILSAIQQAR
jgi:predicted lipid-binding transport protein (Tim44 family)